MKVKCENCEGEGMITCPECGGFGYLEEEKEEDEE